MDNNAAFPIQTRSNHEVFLTPEMGLSKRQYYAACALASGLSPEEAVKAADQLVIELAKPRS